jgi:hypothetical protein
MGGVIDAAAIFAGASAVFDYARRLQDQLPPIVSWQAVRNALNVIQIWNNQYETLLTVRENQIEGGAFGRLRGHHGGGPMSEHSFHFASGVLDDIRKLIAASKAQSLG